MGIIFSGAPTTTGNMTTLRRYGVPGLSATQCGGVVGSHVSGGGLSGVAGFFGIDTGVAEQAKLIWKAYAAATLALEQELASVAASIRRMPARTAGSLR